MVLAFKSINIKFDILFWAFREFIFWTGLFAKFACKYDCFVKYLLC